MTKEERELVLKDLCARLPYDVKVCVYEESDKPEVIWSICTKAVNPYISTENYIMVYPKDVKPYLRPMSSMTNAERDRMRKDINEAHEDITDWLNKYHFDYRGLIQKGLALEAPDGMYDN